MRRSFRHPGRGAIFVVGLTMVGLLVAGALVAIVLPGSPLGGGNGRAPRQPGASGSSAPQSLIVGTHVLLPGLDVDVWRAGKPRSAPVVVLEHSCCGDRADLGKLAEALADSGAVVFNADWSGIRPSSHYPQAYGDVACALAFARQHAAEVGGDARKVALLAWGDGALPAFAIAENPAGYISPGCASVTRDLGPPDAVVAVAGFFGWTWPVPDEFVNARSEAFLGGRPTTVPAAWRAATPYEGLAHYPVRCTTLLIGVQDPLLADARRFAATLRYHGANVRLVIAPYAGDQSMISPRTQEGRTTVAEALAAWHCALSEHNGMSTPTSPR